MSFLKKIQAKYKSAVASEKTLLDEHQYGEFIKALLKKGYRLGWDDNKFSTPLDSGYELRGFFSYNETKIWFEVYKKYATGPHQGDSLIVKWRVLDNANRAADSVFEIDKSLEALNKVVRELDD